MYTPMAILNFEISRPLSDQRKRKCQIQCISTVILWNCIDLKCYMLHLLLKAERNLHDFITADSNKTRLPIILHGSRGACPTLLEKSGDETWGGWNRGAFE